MFLSVSDNEISDGSTLLSGDHIMRDFSLVAVRSIQRQEKASRSQLIDIITLPRDRRGASLQFSPFEPTQAAAPFRQSMLIIVSAYSLQGRVTHSMKKRKCFPANLSSVDQIFRPCSLSRLTFFALFGIWKGGYNKV